MRHMVETALRHFSQRATKALFYEVSLSPKPGLVDRWNDGSHHDMTFTTFIDSSLALAPFFHSYLQIGFKHAYEAPEHIFDRLRALGIEAEKAMFAATSGINTHKGINFSFAVLLGATGIHLKRHPKLLKHPDNFSHLDSWAICQLAIPMCQHLIQSDLHQLDTKKELTYGEKLYLEHGIKGPRGEASLGFPSLTDKALPFFRQQLKNGDKELAQLQLLVYLMTFVEDGNLIHRGGIEAWQKVMSDSQQLHHKELSKKDLIDELTLYNQELVDAHLSPGGTADLFALALFFAFLEGLL